MNDELDVLSYTLAVMASVCFISGLAILSRGRVRQHGEARIHHSHIRRVV